MKESMKNEVVVNAEAFTIATQMYVRLRRVCGRVIDVMYLVNNKDYAKHILELALATQDPELERFVLRLSPLIDLYPEPATLVNETKVEEKKQAVEVLESYSMEVTEEEIYQAQVHHHYIGALR
ncbi:hypothetical protein GCM10025882_23760 [Acinetobacter gyllenbergii]|uniref:Uncharacterized protein n=1 Tax=Acinetobacter gyllenbergii CIP 110306 = MTCC 11365 TaxID=1217657 RepID=A0A829HN93_9GAMM|nr:hypothetical protein [Acinetobacter gyllenbergii]EPF93421.1 hypothetical protein F957_00217 [Acinetobacter gyllenbergii CIP 110306 = MTCC 11365]EPH32445.1 hypothetical protein L293_1538 [Acinetobacter gyllenbergii CIP 110306 = MTCC 11365]OBY75580.1 hypothetical protein NG55_02595 [Acinetobacter gyllenbergii]GMA11951.1 hypothetical protein GCM10025882_23760 [Acinetobacter gyllenbergii]